MKAAFQNAFEAYVKTIMETYGAVGMAVTAIDAQKTLYRRFFGWADIQRQQPINEDTLFGLASVTKSFTCLAIMQLYEKRIIDINDPVSKYIPEFTNKNGKTVRVYHLMSHSAGFYPQKRLCVKPVAQALGLDPYQEDLAYSEKLAQEGIRRVAENLDNQTERIADPGEFLSYSNDSYGLLADIIRRYGGQRSYAEYIKKNLLDPLGMERSCCDFLKVAQDPNTATLYYHQDGELRATRDFYDHAFVLMGGGSLKSTITEMEKYVRMYLLNGWGEMEQIIQSESIGQMVIPRVNYRYGSKYGFGLAISRLEDWQLLGHGGSLPGVSSQFLWSPQLQKGVVVLCNTSGVPVSAVAQAAMRMLADLPPVEQPAYRERPWDEETVRAACGSYECDEGTTAELVPYENGIGIVSGDTVLPMKMLAPDVLVFRDRMVDGDVKLFFRKKDGSVWGLRRGGRVLKKIK